MSGNKMTDIADISDEVLFNELYACEIAKGLFGAETYKNKWLSYKMALMAEMNRRNEPFNHLTDDEIISQLAL